MHPNLEDPQWVDCSDVINALNECHAKLNFFGKQFKCNNMSEDVNKCLHQARLNRRRENNREGRERRTRMLKAVKE
ncbi:hypothetical protein V1512DRAFT_262625 [Lipomyces arxii]|uniref:uncharacterized protein n=1 Tax=Lipomyces arxii TaxID=56418 RepID=UPI0034CE6515